VATESLVEVLIWNWRRFNGRDGGRIENGLGAEDEDEMEDEDFKNSDSDVEELYDSDVEDSYSDGSDESEECKCKCRLFFFDRENLDLGLRFSLVCFGLDLRVIEYLFLDE
jgi:hypothetical protein